MRAWQAVAAWLVFVAVSTTVATACGVLAGRIATPAVWFALSAGAVAAWAAARGAWCAPRAAGWADVAVLAVFALASLRAFLWVVYDDGGDLKVLSPHNLGDLALHLNLIHGFANGAPFWPENPFLAGAGFFYHPGMDLWNALLRVAGVPVVEGLRWAGLLGAAATAVCLWRWGGAFAVAAFLFGGGLSVVALLQTGTLDAAQADLAWKNPFLSIFVTQRGLLESLPAGLMLLAVWHARLAGDREGPRLPWWAEMALYATMPLFNAPAFLFLSAVLAACVLAAGEAGVRRAFLRTGVVSVIPATWLVHLITGGFNAPSALRFAPGWMQEDAGAGFWLLNFGAFLPLAAALLVKLARERAGAAERAALVFAGVGAGTLVFSFLFLIAPWAWDNTKLILWGYLAIVPFLWRNLVAEWPAWARDASCLVLFASGAASLFFGLDARHGYKLADRAELAGTQVLLRSLPAGARLAAAPSYEHPALILGQPVVMGYDGHLFSQGLDYAGTWSDLDRLMSGADGWRDAGRRLQARFLFWGAREARAWPQSTKPWSGCGRVVAQTPHGTLWFILPCLLQEGG